MAKSKRKDGLVYSTGTPPPGPQDTHLTNKTPSGPGVAKLRLEKKGRGGKAVTVIQFRNTPESALEPLAKKLKSACGVGGTTKGDVVEIQGDQRQRLREMLTDEGFRVKG